jgi:hypothetical protein
MSDCDVCIGTDSLDESFDFFHVDKRKARKPHKCCECGMEIPLRAVYEHVIGKYDGEFQKYDTCSICVDIRDVFTCGNSWYYGKLWEEMQEYAFDRLTTASPCFMKLGPEAKAFVLERWRKWKGL